MTGDTTFAGTPCSMKDRDLAFVVYDNAKKVNPRHAGFIRWSKAVQVLKEREVREAKDGPGFSFISLKPQTSRASINVEHISAAVLDVDNGPSFEEIKTHIQSFEFFAYSSFSHTKERPKYRLIFPLVRDVKPIEWPALWRWINELIGGYADSAAKDVSRFYFWPSCPPLRRSDAFDKYNPGEWLNPDNALLNTEVKFGLDAKIVNGAFAVPSNFPPSDAFHIAEGCQQIRMMRDTRGNMPEPLWYAAIGVLAHCENGDRLIHDWSTGHPNYSTRESDLKIAQVRKKGIGPTTCEVFKDKNANGCAGCPHSLKITSPIQLGWIKRGFGELATKLDRKTALTDLGNAERLVSANEGAIRYLSECKKWIFWDRTRWCFDEDGEVMRRAKVVARAINAEAATQTDLESQKAIASHARASQSRNRLEAMCELAKTEPGIPIPACQLDRHQMLLGVANGIVDLTTGSLRPPQPGDYITKRAHVLYDSTAACPTWRTFLARVMAGDDNLIEFIRRAIGYSLTGSIREQCLFLLHGTGANGKSTLLNVMQELLGDYALQCPVETLMVKRSGGVPNDLARLRGARFVAASETEDGQRFAESLIKQLTGGDKISARFLYGEFFEFSPTHKIWLAANHKPMIRGDDEAIWRRIRLIPFAVTIPQHERDPDLPDALRAELPGILNWVIEGVLKWQLNGLCPPSSVTAATAQYRLEMDAIGNWVNERCVTANGVEAKASELYASYRQWAEANGQGVLSMMRFTYRLNNRYSKERRASGVFFKGIGLPVLH